MHLKHLPIFIIAFFLLSQKSQAQLSKLAIGGGFNYTKYLGNFGEGNAGINARISYDVFEKGTASIGFLYGFPIKSTSTTTANSLSSQNSTYSIEVPTEDQIAFKAFYGNFNYFFLKDNESPFGIYASLGVGVTMATIKTTYGPYDRTKYSIGGYSSDESETVMGFTINGGIGAQAKIGVAAIFAEGLLGIPATSVNGEEVENNIPLSVCTNLGVKFHLGSSKQSSKTKGKKKR